MRRFAPYLLLAVAAVAVFGPVLGHDFIHYDDIVNVVDNQGLAALDEHHLRRFWTGPYVGLYAPVPYSIFALEAAATRALGWVDADGQLQARLFHLGNLILHLACACFVFRIGQLLRYSRAAALAGSLLFLVHPLQAETVNWVTETRGLCAALFGLVSVECYLRAMGTGIPGSSDRRAQGWFYTAGVVALNVALLSKPSAAAVAPLLIIVERCFFARSWFAAILPTIPHWGIALAWGIVNRSIQSTSVMPVPPAPWQRLLVAADAWSFYAMKVVWPWPLSFDYGRNPAAALGSYSIIASVALPGALMLAALLRTRRADDFPVPRRPVLGAVLLFTAGLLPTLGLVPFYYQEISTVADRYAYFALLGVAIGMAEAVRHSSSRALLAGVATALVVAAALSHIRTRQWHDSVTLAQAELRNNPATERAYTIWAAWLEAHGATPEKRERLLLDACDQNPRSATLRGTLGTILAQQQRWEDAREQFRRGLWLAPTRFELREGLAAVCQSMGDLAEAEAQLRRMLDQVPNHAPTRCFLAKVLLQQGRASEAAQAYRDALVLAPHLAIAWTGLASCEAAQAHWQAAEEAVRMALKIEPDATSPLLEEAGIMVNTGRRVEAVARYREILRREPASVDARNNLAVTLLSLGQAEEARLLLEETLAAHPREASAHYNLGAILERAGNVGGAVDHYRIAIETAPSYFEARWALATALERTGQTEPALVQAAELARRWPQSAEIRNLLGVCLARLGRVDEARRQFDEALRLEPGSPAAIENLKALGEAGNP